MTEFRDQSTSYVDVVLPVPLRQSFTYKVLSDIADLTACRVYVPFGKRFAIGFVIRHHNDKVNTSYEIKTVRDIIDTVPLIDFSYFKWILLSSDYYHAPLGLAFQQAIPAYFWDYDQINKNPKIREAKSSKSTWVTDNITQLNLEQESVSQILKSKLNLFFPFLLFGITGSGKTEVYIDVMKAVLKEGKSVLFLLPEIGLTPQMMSRLEKHFGDNLLVTHSGLTQNQRLNHWNRARRESGLVIMGTRSALFSPAKNLGLIIIDEEHDTSYKQDDRFRYHARQLALLRAQDLKIPIILGSATPSLEMWHLAKESKIGLGMLSKRASDAKLPQMTILDYTKEKEHLNHNLAVAKQIHDEIDKNFSQGSQSMIFVGQRGYAQNAFCKACKEILSCPNCAVGLTYHRHGQKILCHYCQYTDNFQFTCPKCQENQLILIGTGIQAIEEEIKTLHPHLKIMRLDSDAITTHSQQRQILEDFFQKKYDVLIGTQMIAKGHDFSNVNLVVAIGVDAQLGLADFRANERAFNNLVQVAGRAGRASQQAKVLVQALNPEHTVFKMAQSYDYVTFANEELKARQFLLYPPFSRLMQIKFYGNHDSALQKYFSLVRPFLDQLQSKYNKEELKILGIVPMPISKIKNKFRYHLIIKIKKGLKINDFSDYLLNVLEKNSSPGINITVDIDPLTMI